MKRPRLCWVTPDSGTFALISEKAQVTNVVRLLIPAWSYLPT
jgi:hypothetical protein